MSVLSAAGEPWALYPLTAVLASGFIAKKQPEDAFSLVLGLVGSAGINKVLKQVVHRPRPLWKLPLPRSGASGSSFPSNHAIMSLGTYGMIAFLLQRELTTRPKGTQRHGRQDPQAQEAQRSRDRVARRVSALIWASLMLFCGLIGFSRVYQGVHNPTDVLGGWLAGGIWLFACTRVVAMSNNPAN